MADRPGWLPDRTGLLVCLLTGFVVPFLGPVAVVRYCPDEARYSFPFVFSKDFLETSDVTMVIGLIANTLLGAALVLGVMVGLLGAVRSWPLPVGLVDWLRGLRRGLVPILAAGAFFVVFLGFNDPSVSAAVGPGHVDTPACAHVSGHALVNNWWGPERFSLLSLKRVGLV